MLGKLASGCLIGAPGSTTEEQPGKLQEEGELDSGDSGDAVETQVVSSSCLKGKQGTLSIPHCTCTCRMFSLVVCQGSWQPELLKELAQGQVEVGQPD